MSAISREDILLSALEFVTEGASRFATGQSYITHEQDPDGRLETVERVEMGAAADWAPSGKAGGKTRAERLADTAWYEEVDLLARRQGLAFRLEPDALPTGTFFVAFQRPPRPPSRRCTCAPKTAKRRKTA